MAGAAPAVMRLASSVAANIHPFRVHVMGARCVPADPERALDRLSCPTELETSMNRTFLSLAVVALAGLATAVHAADGAAARSTVMLPHAGQARGPMMFAQLIGKGEPGEPCHAYARDKEIRRGTYDYDNGELVCKIGGDEILCHPEDNNGPPDYPLCRDGYKD
jgi:hypothetical protein